MTMVVAVVVVGWGERVVVVGLGGFGLATACNM